MSAGAERGKLTGRKVLAIAVGAFGVIIAVNLVMAYFAVNTFSGLVVRNSYIASQGFDASRDAQEALGWTVTLEHADEALRIAITGADGGTVRPDLVDVTIGRPTTDRDDMELDMQSTPSGYAAPAPLAPGTWRVEITALAADGTPFRQSRSIFVRDAE